MSALTDRLFLESEMDGPRKRLMISLDGDCLKFHVQEFCPKDHPDNTETSQVLWGNIAKFSLPLDQLDELPMP